MTRKDFIIIAEILKELKVRNKSAIVEHFCQHLKTTNPRFDAEKFKKATENGIKDAAPRASYQKKQQAALKMFPNLRKFNRRFKIEDKSA